MTKQEHWIDYCINNDNEICIFDKPFWLDAVSGGRKNWNVFLVEENGRIEAALPFYQKKRRGLSYITMPPFTPCNGIWLRPVEQEKTEKRINRENVFYKMLIDQIEASGFSFYQQSFSPKVKNWQPFYWMGYEQKTLYTFCINHPYSLAEAEKNFSKSTRQSLRRASQAYTISELDDVVLFYKLHCMTYTRKNREAPFAFSLIQRIYKACKENGAVKMLFMQDGEKNICSTLLLVYDAKNVYSLMSGLSQEKRSNNIFGLLEYEGIKFACETGRCYDFEGSMLEGVSKYNRGFGAEMYPYYGVRKVLTKTPILRQYLKYRLHAL